MASISFQQDAAPPRSSTTIEVSPSTPGLEANASADISSSSPPDSTPPNSTSPNSTSPNSTSPNSAQSDSAPLAAVLAAQAGPSPAPPEPRREAGSFADFFRDVPDPALHERQQRLRRIVAGVMMGAMGLLLLAGLCGLVRYLRGEPDVANARSAATMLTVADVPSVPSVVASPDLGGRAVEPPAARAHAPRPRRPIVTPLHHKLP